MKTFTEFLNEQYIAESEYEVTFDWVFNSEKEMKSFKSQMKKKGITVVSIEDAGNGADEITMKGNKNVVVKWLEDHGMDEDGFPE